MQVAVEHLTPALIECLDRELARAIADVDAGRVAKAGVSLAFAVGLDEDAKTVVVYTHKSAGAAKGSFQPARQARLPLEEDEEEDGQTTVMLPGGSGTLLRQAAERLSR